MPAAPPTARHWPFVLVALLALASVLGRGPVPSEQELLLRSERRRALWAYGVGLVISVLLGLALVLGAIDTQSGLVPDLEGHAWAFGVLFGPNVFGGRQRHGWSVLTTPGQLVDQERFTSLLHAHLGWDLALIAAYGVLLGLVVGALCRTRGWRWTGFGALALLIASDLLENLFALRILANPDELSTVLFFTRAKWAMAGLLGIVLVLRLVIRPPDSTFATLGPRAVDARRSTRRALKAVVHQRFSYAPVLAIAALSIPSGAAILEQLPDAQRQWVFDSENGLRHATAAILCTTLLGLFLLAIGRVRTRYAFDHAPLPEVERQANDHRIAQQESWRNLIVWLVGPGLVLLGALGYVLSGEGELVLWGRTGIFVAVPLLLAGASLITLAVWRWRPRWRRPDRPPEFSRADAFAVGVAGTVAGVGAVVVGGLSLVRALTPLVVLPPQSYVPLPDDSGSSALPEMPRLVGALLVVAVLGIVLPWLVMIGFTLRYGGPGRLAWDDQPGRLARTLAGARRRWSASRLVDRARPYRGWLVLAVAIGAFVGLGIWPRFAATVGLAATATLAFGSLAGMLSGVGLVLQDRPTAPIFRLLGLRRTPLVSLLVLTVVLVSASSGDRSLHGVVRGPSEPPAGVTARPVVRDAFRDWLKGAEQCQVTVAGYRVRPMLMIAAEGGGVRASYWTVRGLQAIDDATCGEFSTFFSGGASGGSVGLTVARFSQPTPEKPSSRVAVDAVKEMAKPATLSRAADGTFVRDLIYGGTGVPVPRLFEHEPLSWQDRARLIENGWTRPGGWGERTFLDRSAVSPAPGALVLNSTSVTGNCRVWLSQLELPSPPAPRQQTFDPEQNCDKVSGVATRTIDLFDAYGPLDAPKDASCLGYVSAATAALLTARFPYVTPSGVIGPCPNRAVDPGRRSDPYWPRTQLVDGGYIENSGIATITDLADVWLPHVRRQNDLAIADESRTEALVVPIMVYLTNGEQPTTQPALNASPVSELAVPPTTYLAAGDALTDSAALLGRARDAVELTGFCPANRAASVCLALQGSFPSRVVVVDRATQPEVSAPLGWVLSDASITSLDNAMKAQLYTWCPANLPSGVGAPTRSVLTATTKATCRPGYATLGDLQRYLTRSYPTPATTDR